MKTYLDCIPCFFKQVLEAARLAGADLKMQKKILDKMTKLLPKFPLSSSPPEMGRVIYNLVKKSTLRYDPYKKIKDKSNSLAIRLYSRLKKKVSSGRDRLLTATCPLKLLVTSMSSMAFIGSFRLICMFLSAVLSECNISIFHIP